MLSRMQPATDFAQMIRDQFSMSLRLSQRQPLVCGVSLHTFVAGQPFRLAQIERVLREIMADPAFTSQVWVTTPGEIARFAEALPPGTVSGDPRSSS
jgi:hypothetical protein